MAEQPLFSDITCFLQSCRKRKNLKDAKHLYALVCSSGMDIQMSVGNYIVPMFVECGSILDPENAFNNLFQGNQHSWASIVSGYVGYGHSQHAFSLHKKMKGESVQPSSRIFAVLLKACAKLRDEDAGLQIHLEVKGNGLEKDLFVGSALIDLYVKCGSLTKARKVFDMMPVCDVVSWTALISGYAEQRHGREALECYEQTQFNGMSPDSVTLICVLKACCSIGAIDMGREIHTVISRKGLEKDNFIGNALLGMYAKCGLMVEAREVFCNLPVRDVVSWNTLITGYVENKSEPEALKLNELMQLKGVSPNVVTFISALKACANMGALDKGREIHNQIPFTDCIREPFVGNILVYMYAKCGSLAEAQEAFDKLHVRDIVSWTSIISGYAESGNGKEALKCFNSMQLEGMTPNVVTFVYILKACASLAIIAKGRETHSELVQKGFQTDLFVGNSLIDMYSKCASLEEASKVFSELPVQDVVSWNILISGFVEHGLEEEALICFMEMQMEGFIPNAFTYVCCLKACSNIGALNRGRIIHKEIPIEYFEGSSVVGNVLINMYIKLHSIMEANCAFDRLPFQDASSWNTLISGYSESRLDLEALTLFERMQVECISPNATTFMHISRICGRIRAIEKGRKVHAKTRFGRAQLVGNDLVDMYVKCNSLLEALEVFNKLPIQDVNSWNALIVGCAENELNKEALSYFEQMQLDGISPNTLTFVSIFKACRNTQAIDRGREMHTEVIQNGLVNDIFIGNTLIDMYAKCASMLEAQEVFNNLLVRDLVSWNVLIAGYVETGFFQEALNCTEEMKLKGVFPDDITLASCLRACGILRFVEKGRKLHSEAFQKGCESSVVVASCLINMYGKCGLLGEASKVFDRLLVRSVVSWTGLIEEYVGNGFGKEGLKLFEQMCIEGISPNAVTFSCALRACGLLSSIGRGRELHCLVVQMEFERDNPVGNTLVDMYAKCGSLKEAQDVFKKLSVQDVTCWSTLIAGYANSGCGQDALKIFERMQEEGWCPNAVTFVCIFKACGSIGALVEGREIHAEVLQNGYDNDLSVGNSLVAMYIKCGSLSDALQTFDSMPIQDTVSWNVLIEAYSENDLELMALKCYEQMQLEGMLPDPVTFACSLKACCTLGTIHKGRELHAEISQRRLEQDPFVGNSLVSMYTNCGSLVEAQGVFDRLPVQDLVAWTALIAGYVEHQSGHEALKCVEQMQLEGRIPDAITLLCTLKACGSIGSIDKGRDIHIEVAESGVDREVHIGPTLIDMYAKAGSLSEARQVFDNLTARDMMSWTAMIRGYGINYHGGMALQCFEDMQELAITPDVITFTCLFSACSRAGLVMEGRKYFMLMQRRYGIVPTIDHYTCMVDLLARSGQLYEAEKLVISIPVSAEAWIALLGSCNTYGEAELGLKCFQKLVQANSVDAASYVLMANTIDAGMSSRVAEFAMDKETSWFKEEG